MSGEQHFSPRVAGLGIFLAIMLVLGCLLGGGLYYLYNTAIDVRMKHAKETGFMVLRQVEGIIHSEMGRMRNDALFLARLGSLKQYLASGGVKELQEAEMDFLSFCSTRDRYDQVRFLDMDGQEVVRINRAEGEVYVQVLEQLQNKAHRLYFSEAIRLAKGTVYYSSIDLNMEYGKVEYPFKPVVRVATPVFDGDGVRRGVLVLNYLADVFFHQVLDADNLTVGHIQLLNGDGYWLFGGEADRRWGFMFSDLSDATFAKDHPKVWQAMQEYQGGEYATPEGLFVFDRFSVRHDDGRHAHADEGVASEMEGVDLRVVNYISTEDILIETAVARQQLLKTGSGIMGLVVVVSWLFSRLMIRRWRHRVELHRLAHHDPLTGLPNRRLFTDRLEQALNNAERYKRPMALLFLDLDGFKAVNDTMGHDAGDELLQSVAVILAACCRKSDTLARLGGDEFAIILSEVSGREGADKVSRKIHDSLAEPVRLTKGTAFIGTSIGIAMYPDDADSAQGLMDVADKAMYQDKERNKTRRMEYRQGSR